MARAVSIPLLPDPRYQRLSLEPRRRCPPVTAYLTSIRAAAAVLVSPISVFEIARKVRLGQWPEMATVMDRPPALLEAQGGVVIGSEPVICLLAGMMDWSHRDPFDRWLAATARHHALPLLSADSVFDGIVTRIW